MTFPRFRDSVTIRERLVTWEDPMRVAERGRSMDGLAFLRAMAAGEIPAPSAAVLCGFRIAEADDGRVVFEYAPDESHYNPLGGVHGGILASVFDAALGCAVHTKLPKGIGYTTLEIKTQFVRPVSKDSGALRCAGEAVHVGRRTGTSTATMTDARGKVVAHGSSTCLVFPLGE